MGRCIKPVLANGSTSKEPIWVPCSRCGPCLRTRQNNWAFRLTEEFNKSEFPTLFVTLTYADEYLPYTMDDCPIIRKHFGDQLDEVTLLTRDLQKWNMLVRQNNSFHTRKQYRYYAAGEYGSQFGRPHYHVIMFNVHPKTMQRLQSYWKYGNIKLEYARDTNKVSAYVAAYVVTAYSNAIRINKRPFSCMSKRPFLGHTYVERMKKYHRQWRKKPQTEIPNLPLEHLELTDTHYQLAYIERPGTNGLYKIGLPRIFKQKLYAKWELNAMKKQVQETTDQLLETEIERIQTLNNYDRPQALQHINDTQFHNHLLILQKAKHSDKHEYQQGNTDASRNLPHHKRHRRQSQRKTNQKHKRPHRAKQRPTKTLPTCTLPQSSKPPRLD